MHQVETKPRPQPAPERAVERAPEPVQARAEQEPQPRPARAVARPKAAPQESRPRRTKSNGPAKLFVLDTNVLLHDPMCLFRFEEHDIYLPMIVLEELDGHKKGTTEVARNGRQTSRTLDALAGAKGADIAKGLRLDTTGHTRRRRQAVLPDRGDGFLVAEQPAAGQGRQPDPRRGACAARPVFAGPPRASEAGSGAGVEGHQHARQGARAGPGRRRLPERQDAGRRRPALFRLARAAARFLDAPEQDRRKLAERQHDLLPDHRPDRAQPLHQPVRVLRGARRTEHVRPRHRDPRQDRGAEDAEGLQLGQERRLGRDQGTANRTSR